MSLICAYYRLICAINGAIEMILDVLWAIIKLLELIFELVDFDYRPPKVPEMPDYFA